VIAPERVEHLRKRRQLIVSLYEQRATRVEHLVPHLDVDVGQRFSKLEDAADRYLEAKAPKDTPEDDEVFDEVASFQGELR
jgi:hypothetical protein